MTHKGQRVADVIGFGLSVWVVSIIFGEIKPGAILTALCTYVLSLWWTFHRENSKKGAMDGNARNEDG